MEKEGGSKVLRCQWHGAEFDIISGKTLTGPAQENSGLRALEVKVENGIIYYE